MLVKTMGSENKAGLVLRDSTKPHTSNVNDTANSEKNKNVPFFFLLNSRGRNVTRDSADQTKAENSVFVYMFVCVSVCFDH